jgi:hypothetical protein
MNLMSHGQVARNRLTQQPADRSSRLTQKPGRSSPLTQKPQRISDAPPEWDDPDWDHSMSDDLPKYDGGVGLG